MRAVRFLRGMVLLGALLGLGMGEARAQESLAVTYVKAPLNIPSILERRLGLMEEAFSGDVTLTYPELTAGPQQTQAMAAGPAVAKAEAAGARVLTTGQGILEATTVIAARGELLRKHPERVARFLEVHRRAVDRMKTHREESFRITAEEVGLPVDEVERMAALYDFDPTIRPSDVEELRKTRDFLFENGLLTEKIEVETLLEK